MKSYNAERRFRKGIITVIAAIRFTEAIQSIKAFSFKKSISESTQVETPTGISMASIRRQSVQPLDSGVSDKSQTMLNIAGSGVNPEVHAALRKGSVDIIKLGSSTAARNLTLSSPQISSVPSESNATIVPITQMKNAGDSKEDNAGRSTRMSVSRKSSFAVPAAPNGAPSSSPSRVASIVFNASKKKDGDDPKTDAQAGLSTPKKDLRAKRESQANITTLSHSGKKTSVTAASDKKDGTHPVFSDLGSIEQQNQANLPTLPKLKLPQPVGIESNDRMGGLKPKKKPID